MKKKKALPRIRVSAETLVNDMIVNCGIYETKHAIEQINRKFNEFSFEDIPKLPESFTMPAPKTEFGTKIFAKREFERLRGLYNDALGVVKRRVAALRSHETRDASPEQN